jgi:hypothetical protein
MWFDPWKDFKFPTVAIRNSTAGVSLPRKTGWRDWTAWENWSGWDDLWQQPNDAGASWQQRDDADASWQKCDDADDSWQKWDNAGASWQKGDDAGASWQTCDDAYASWQKWDNAGASWQKGDDAGASWQTCDDAYASWQKWGDAGASWQKRDTVGASWQTGSERSQWHERDLEWKQNAGAQDAGTSWLKPDVAGASWQACSEPSPWHDRDLEWKFNDCWQTGCAARESWPKPSQYRDHGWNVCAEWETQKCPSGPVGCEEHMVGASSADGASLPAHVSGMRADGTRGTPGVWQTHGPQEGGSNCSEGPWKEVNRRKKERKLYIMRKQNLIDLREFATDVDEVYA